MSENIREILTRICNKHDLEANWQATTNFVPLQGELIIYDREIGLDGELLEIPVGRTTPYAYERLKIGDGITPVNELPFIDETILLPAARVSYNNLLLSDLLDTYLFSIDYNSLAFDTSEIVIDTSAETSAILGKAIIGKMILGNSGTLPQQSKAKLGSAILGQFILA